MNDTYITIPADFDDADTTTGTTSPLSETPTMGVLEEALSIVNGPRQASYGHPSVNYSRTARIWSVILGTELTPYQVALCMIGLKLAREANAEKRDNLVDIAGYAEVADRIAQAERSA